MLILVAVAGPDETKNLAGESPPPDSDLLAMRHFYRKSAPPSVRRRLILV